MYKKIHIKNAIFLTIRYKVYLKFTVKFHDSQNERNMIRFLEGSKTNGKANSEHYFDILSPSMSLNSASFQPRKVKFYAKILRNQFFFFQISDQNIQSASRWFTYDAANHRKRKWQNKEKPPVWKRFTVDDIFCLWDTKNRRYRTLH